MEPLKFRLTYVIDDDEVIRYLTENLFKEVQFCERSEHFLNAREAYDKLKNAAEDNACMPDLILLDLKMPEMDGWHFLEAIEKLPFKDKIPVYVFSSSISDEDIKRAKSYGCVRDYITKPLTIHKINKILRLEK